MKNAIVLLTVLMLSALNTDSCGNFFYSMDKEGNLVPLGYNWKFPFNKNFNPERQVKKLKKIEEQLAREKNYMLLSDYSLCLMKLGKPSEALQILKELYNHYPNEYKLAANLGTAYELNGQNDSALKYIRRGMELNPDDHEGSEWVHVKILETKLALAKDPSHLKTHTVLNLTETQKKDSIVLHHIAIQLQERVPFTPVTPAGDEIMASLFSDLGDISANIRSIEYARAYYQIAKNYYGSKSPELDVKIREMVKLMNKYASKKPEQDRGKEGLSIQVGYFKYTDLLTDNQTANYKVDWQNINTDVNSLLAMADLTRTSAQVKDSAAKNSGKNSELTFNPDPHDHRTKTEKKTDLHEATINSSITAQKTYTWYYVTSAALIFAAGYFIRRQTKNKRG